MNIRFEKSINPFIMIVFLCLIFFSKVLDHVFTGGESDSASHPADSAGELSIGSV